VGERQPQAVPDENTSAYCQARSRLDIDTLREGHEEGVAIAGTRFPFPYHRELMDCFA
jgi:hypothetical protein